ncbi:hypothetical protein SKAU_G00415510 [Synaphobranchus kaupii]|uniref:DDE Tnp4 domain-containing protein n=1 Tax=Synaphobranchus kaupii TaxID=118154 RepID=A0A9Q1E785_SYNKA|nr:hypothetical protein SKAU_G00415510 [Synaphobranchus kaupii]
MKTRFRAIFLQTLEVDPSFVSHVITACCVLHNICLGVGDVMVPDEEPVEVMPEEDGNVSDTQSGAAWRENLCAHLSALEQPDHDHDYC